MLNIVVKFVCYVLQNYYILLTLQPKTNKLLYKKSIKYQFVSIFKSFGFKMRQTDI